MASSCVYIGLFVLCFAAEVVLGQCPDGYVSHRASCYKEFNIRASWDDAEMYCEAYGGHLVTIEDDLEHQFVVGHLQREGLAAYKPGIFWLGGSDRSHEGRWFWTAGAQAMAATYWKPGEPNNAGPHGENCLGMAFTDNLQWNDEPCTLLNNFVCENEKSLNTGSIIG